MSFSPKEHFKKLKETLAPMTPKKRLEHLWTYYKWVLGLLAGLIVLISIVSTSIANINREVLIGGILVNADVSLDGQVYISDGYFIHRGGVEGDQEVQVTNSIFEDPFTAQNVEYTYNATLKVMAMVNAKSVDYMIMDEMSMEFYLSQDMFEDLNVYFTAEELAAMEADLIYLEYEETGERIPVAINLRNTGFSEAYIESEDAHYISFVNNTPRPEACRDFWDYLVACEPTE